MLYKTDVTVQQSTMEEEFLTFRERDTFHINVPIQNEDKIVHAAQKNENEFPSLISKLLFFLTKCINQENACDIYNL